MSHDVPQPPAASDTLRCAWTGSASERTITVELPGVDRWARPSGLHTWRVLPEHEAALRRYLALALRWGRLFFWTVLFAAAALVAAAVAGSTGLIAEPAAARVAGGSVILIGGLLLVFPFTTPETTAALGIGPARALARTLGAITVALGFLIMFLA